MEERIIVNRIHPKVKNADKDTRYQEFNFSLFVPDGKPMLDSIKFEMIERFMDKVMNNEIISLTTQ